MIHSQISRLLFLVVKHLCTKFESCTIKISLSYCVTLKVFKDKFASKITDEQFDYNFMRDPNKDTMALSVYTDFLSKRLTFAYNYYFVYPYPTDATYQIW